MNRLHGLRVTVMGLGQFGGGVGVVRYFLDRGARVTLTDLQSEERLRNSLQQFDRSRLETLTLGEHRLEDFLAADLVVVNPGVRRQGNRFLEAAEQGGARLSSEMNLFWERNPGRTLAVTGTVGKSTTAALIHHCLAAAGHRPRLGGNIGRSLLPEVEEISPEEWVVLELSSFQLADLEHLGGGTDSPGADVAVITNFHPNHLHWHGSIAAYREAKQSLLSRQTASGVAVLNADDPEVSAWTTPARKVWFGTGIGRGIEGVRIEPDRLVLQQNGRETGLSCAEFAESLRFPHQRQNVAGALAALAFGIGLDVEAFRPALTTFAGLPHRLQTVLRRQGRLFINDSKATTPEATQAALSAVPGPAVLIAGGRDQQVDLRRLAESIATRTKGVALLGETAEELSRLVGKQAPQLPLLSAKDLSEALCWAMKHSTSGETVLFSPGCASDGEFLNYEERGDRFEELCRQLNDRA